MRTTKMVLRKTGRSLPSWPNAEPCSPEAVESMNSRCQFREELDKAIAGKEST